jgi:hypothetical protein
VTRLPAHSSSRSEPTHGAATDGPLQIDDTRRPVGSRGKPDTERALRIG